MTSVTGEAADCSPSLTAAVQNFTTAGTLIMHLTARNSLHAIFVTWGRTFSEAREKRGVGSAICMPALTWSPTWTGKIQSLSRPPSPASSVYSIQEGALFPWTTILNITQGESEDESSDDTQEFEAEAVESCTLPAPSSTNSTHDAVHPRQTAWRSGEEGQGDHGNILYQPGNDLEFKVGQSGHSCLMWQKFLPSSSLDRCYLHTQKKFMILLRINTRHRWWGGRDWDKLAFPAMHGGGGVSRAPNSN